MRIRHLASVSRLAALLLLLAGGTVSDGAVPPQDLKPLPGTEGRTLTPLPRLDEGRRPLDARTPPPRGESPPPSISDAKFEIKLYRTRRGTAYTSISNVSLKPETVTVAQPIRLDDLLLLRGVRPDRGSLSLVYEWNPRLERIGMLQHGVKLLLPDPRTDAALVVALQDAAYISFSGDEALLAWTRTNGEKLKRWEDVVSRAPVGKYFPPPDAADALAALKRATETLPVFTGDNSLVTSQLLWQANVQAELIDQALAKSSSAGQPLTMGEISLLEASSADLVLKAQHVQAGLNPNVPVVVRTFTKGKAVEKSGLEVFYAVEALHGDARYHNRFPRLSSPSEYVLPIANYRMWVVGAGEWVSEEAKVQVRRPYRGDEMVVELIVR